MVRVITASFGEDNYTGLATMNEMGKRPESVLYIVPMVVAMQRAGWNESLDAVTSALRPAPELAAQAPRLRLDMPQAAIEANLADTPPRKSVCIPRHRAAIEGHLEISPGD